MEKITVGTSRQTVSQDRLAKLHYEGGRRASGAMREFLQSGRLRGTLDGERVTVRNFGSDLIRLIHKKVLFYAHPDVRGSLRPYGDVNTYVMGVPAVSGTLVPMRFARYGEWLGKAAEQITEAEANPDRGEDDKEKDMIKGIYLAASAHNGLVTPDLHPMPDGNNRTARAVGVNGLLMLGTRELMDYHIAVPPVPVLWNPITSRGRKSPYETATKEGVKTGTTNAMERYIAEVWSGNLEVMLDAVKSRVRKPNQDDIKLISQFEWRTDVLQRYLRSCGANGTENDLHFLPDELRSYPGGLRYG